MLFNITTQKNIKKLLYYCFIFIPLFTQSSDGSSPSKMPRTKHTAPSWRPYRRISPEEREKIKEKEETVRRAQEQLTYQMKEREAARKNYWNCVQQIQTLQSSLTQTIIKEIQQKEQEKYWFFNSKIEHTRAMLKAAQKNLADLENTNE